MFSNVGNGLFYNLFRKSDVSGFNGGETHGDRKTAVRVPNHPYFETKYRNLYLFDFSLTSPEVRCFFLGYLASALASFCDSRSEASSNAFIFREKRVGCQNRNDFIENPLQGLAGNGDHKRCYKFRTNRPSYRSVVFVLPVVADYQGFAD